jgi:hypothetical protein
MLKYWKTSSPPKGEVEIMVINLGAFYKEK